MSLFFTETASKSNQVNKATIKQCLRGEDPEKLKSALQSFKKSSQFDQEFLDESLMQCSKQDQGDFVKVLLEEGANPNSGSFRTPLQWALMMNKENSAQALILGGADVDFGNPPPITIAASLGRLNSVKLMLEKGVDVNKMDTDNVLFIS